MKTFFKHTIMKIKILFFVFLLVNAGIMLAKLPLKLYIVGSSASTGWQITKALAFETVSSGLYKYSGPLFAGEYKFANSQDNCWCQDFYVKEGIVPKATPLDDLYTNQFVTTR